MNDLKTCCFCGATGHRAHECKMRPPEPPPLPRFDRLARYGAECAEVAAERVRASLLKKFDAYVPADVASGMRWRILELEAQLADGPTEAAILALADRLTAHPDAKTPVIRGRHDVLAFARAVLALRGAPPKVEIAADAGPFQRALAPLLAPFRADAPITDPAAIEAAFAADDERG